MASLVPAPQLAEVLSALSHAQLTGGPGRLRSFGAAELGDTVLGVFVGEAVGRMSAGAGARARRTAVVQFQIRLGGEVNHALGLRADGPAPETQLAFADVVDDDDLLGGPAFHLWLRFRPRGPVGRIDVARVHRE